MLLNDFLWLPYLVLKVCAVMPRTVFLHNLLGWNLYIYIYIYAFIKMWVHFKEIVTLNGVN